MSRPKKFKNDDYRFIKTVQGLKVSPDGKNALYEVMMMDPDEDMFKTYLWIINLETEKEYQLTGCGMESGAFWEDNDHVAFASPREPRSNENETVYFRINIHGGEAEEFIHVPLAHAQLSPLGKGSYLVRAMTSVDVKCEEKTDKWMFFNEYPYLNNGLWYASRQRRSLFVWNEKTRNLKQITPPLMQTHVPYFSDDVIVGENALYYVGYEYDRDAAGKTCVCKYTWEDEKTSVLCESDCEIFSLIRRDGRIYYSSWTIAAGPDLARIRIMSVDESGGDAKEEANPQWEPRAVRQRNGQTIFTMDSKAEASMARWNDGMSYEVIPTEGVNPTCAIPLGDDVIFTGWKTNRLQEVYRYRHGSVKQMSHQNDELYKSYSFSEPEPLSVMVGNDEVCGWVIKPANYRAGIKYPGILSIHGGPHGCYDASFNSEHQRWANEGYFVFFCNPHGSTTYGTDFMNITSDMGGADYHDLMTFTDKVLKFYPDLNGDRLAVTGQSYGGIMTNWIIGHTSRFKAAVPRMSVSNWISMHGSAVERWYGDDLLGGTPWTDFEKLWKHSALKYAGNVTTPTLFIQHEKDQSCPMEEAQQMFTALLERGVPTKMMVNLSCFHGGRSVSQMLHDIDVMMAWFEQYLNV